MSVQPRNIGRIAGSFRKGRGKEAKLCHMGNLEGRHRITLGTDKAYDAANFIAKLREIKVTLHVTQNTINRRSAISAPC